MIKRPKQNPAQQIVYAPLQALVSAWPAIGLWVGIQNKIAIVLTSLTTSALDNVYRVGTSVANVMDYLQTQYIAEIPSSQYLAMVALTARTLANNAKVLERQNNAGTIDVQLDIHAQNALALLETWDPVQGYQPPGNLNQLFSSLVGGIHIT